MKAILQVGAAQFVVEGAAFHLLCKDIAATLGSLVCLDEGDISLTLHTDRLERCVADDARLLHAIGVSLPATLPTKGGRGPGGKVHGSDGFQRDSPSDDDDEHAADDGLQMRNVPLVPPRRLSVSPVREPLNIFSSDSFDVAEAAVQQLQARAWEQRLLLERCMEEGIYRPETGDKPDGGGDDEMAAVRRRVVPLPTLRLVTVLATEGGVTAEYNAQGQRRRSSVTVGEVFTPPQ